MNIHYIQESRVAGVSTESPSITFAPSSTAYPSASGTPTTSPLPTTGESERSGYTSSTSIPSASGTPTTSPFPTLSWKPSQYTALRSNYPTASGTPTTSPFPSSSQVPTISKVSTASPIPLATHSPTKYVATNTPNSTFGHQKACSNFVEGPDQVDTEVVFTYVAESRETSVDFLTELEVQLLDHAGTAVLECSDSSAVKIYRLSFPTQEAASDATTCEMTHVHSKSCWIMQTRIFVASDRESIAAAKYTVLNDIQKQLDDGNLLTTSFRDLTFTQYLGPNPVDYSGTTLSLPAGVVRDGGSQALKWIATAAVGLAVTALLGFFALLYYVRRKKGNAAAIVDLQGFCSGTNDKSDMSVEVIELLSRSKTRLKEHPIVANNDSFDDEGSIVIESFHDEHPVRNEFYNDSHKIDQTRADSRIPLENNEHRRVSSSQSTQKDDEPSSRISELQRLHTSSKNQTSRSTYSRGHESVHRSSSHASSSQRSSSQRSSSQRQHDDSSRRSSSSRHESSSRLESQNRSSSRPTSSRADHSSRSSGQGRTDDTHRSMQRNIPSAEAVDSLDALCYQSGKSQGEPSHPSSRQLGMKENPRQSTLSSRRSTSERGDCSQRAISDRSSSTSDRGDASRRSTSQRGEMSSRRSTSSRKISESSLYGDPVEMAKERMAIANFDAESRRRRRSQSSSRAESAKFDNVDIV